MDSLTLLPGVVDHARSFFGPQVAPSDRQVTRAIHAMVEQRPASTSEPAPWTPPRLLRAYGLLTERSSRGRTRLVATTPDGRSGFVVGVDLDHPLPRVTMVSVAGALGVPDDGAADRDELDPHTFIFQADEHPVVEWWITRNGRDHVLQATRTGDDPEPWLTTVKVGYASGETYATTMPPAPGSPLMIEPADGPSPMARFDWDEGRKLMTFPEPVLITHPRPATSHPSAQAAFDAMVAALPLSPALAELARTPASRLP